MINLPGLSAANSGGRFQKAAVMPKHEMPLWQVAALLPRGSAQSCTRSAAADLGLPMASWSGGFVVPSGLIDLREQSTAGVITQQVTFSRAGGTTAILFETVVRPAEAANPADALAQSRQILTLIGQAARAVEAAREARGDMPQSAGEWFPQ